jgi:hypothetical protein
MEYLEASEVKNDLKNVLSARLMTDESKRNYENQLAELAHTYIVPLFEDMLAQKDPATTPELRFKVAKELLDRYLGKPKETIDLHETIELKIDI